MGNNLYFKNNLLIKDDKIYSIDSVDYCINNLDEFYAYFGNSALTNKVDVGGDFKTPGLLSDGFHTESVSGTDSVYIDKGKYVIKNNYDISGNVVPYELYNRLVFTSNTELYCEKDVQILYKTQNAGFHGKNETDLQPFDISNRVLKVRSSSCVITDTLSERDGDSFSLNAVTSLAFFDATNAQNNYIDSVDSVNFANNSYVITMNQPIPVDSPTTLYISPDYNTNVVLDLKISSGNGSISEAVNVANVINYELNIVED